MELRDQDKEMGISSSLSYINNKLKGDSNSLLKVSSSVPINPLRTLINHHTESNAHHQLDQDPDPAVSAPISTVQPPSSVPGGGGPSPTLTAISSTPLIRYRECLKNHATGMGGHVVDGCGEFMPSGEDDTQEALKCAACECHRNFHRKEINGESLYPHKNNTRRDSTVLHPQQPMPLRQQRVSLGLSNGSCLPIAPPVMMNFGGGGGPTDSSSEDLNMFHSNAGDQQSSKKRFRTKFSQDQKNKMMEFGEKLGWRIQKQDEAELQQFCGEVGIKRQVFKVWMHNSKQAMKKRKPM